MATERWLTLPDRAGLLTDDLVVLVHEAGNDYQRAWDTCQEPRFLLEMAAAAGLPVDTILLAAAACCGEAWSEWSGGATDARPTQIVNAVTQWAQRRSGFEQIWSSWELAERVKREVQQWFEAQQGDVLATAIVHAVDAIHTLATTARDLAEPEEGHDQADVDRYHRKNSAAENSALVHAIATAVQLATTAGAYWHSHEHPTEPQSAHDGYANQMLGFILRKHIDADAVVQGLRDRL